jgi:hypothetical protein
MRHAEVLFLGLTLGLLTLLNVYQAHVINQQRQLIQQMMSNPACMVGRVQ